MRRGRDPSRTPSRPRRPVWDNPGGQIPGTGIRSDAENLYSGNLRGGSTQGVSGNSSGGLAVTGESSSGGRSLPVNVFTGEDRAEGASFWYAFLTPFWGRKNIFFSKEPMLKPMSDLSQIQDEPSKSLD